MNSINNKIITNRTDLHGDKNSFINEYPKSEKYGSVQLGIQSPQVTETLCVAYLVNQYPKVSHSFIRREILALERQGVRVQRVALRGWAGELLNSQDECEREQTHYVLQGGWFALLKAMATVLLAHPGAFFATLWLATRLGWRADRPLPLHWVYFAEACVIHRWLKATRAQHLHAHFGTNPAEVAMLVHALGGPPYSFTVHGPEEFDKPESLHLADKLRAAAFVVAISSYGRSQLFRWVAQAHWHKVHVVHCGLEPEFHANTSSSPPASPRLVCVGRLCEQKGQLLLIQAAHQVIQQGLELVLAGDGEMRAPIEALIDQLNLRAHVRITGWISSEQVRTELLAARAMVLPSFAEGLPVVLMEAMALRRPVITTFVAGIPELVRQGQDGWLFPAGDLDGLVQAMSDCLTASTERLAHMAESAHERVLARHNVDVEAAKLTSLFKGLL
jgi:colanic acid/amylovoran biosynthesis glycosyltransferase